MRASIRAVVGAVAALGVALVVVSPSPALAHTDSDVVAVPAGGEATVTLKPTHGCDGSPTVEVAIRAPVAGAVAGDVAGWTATVTPDDDGRTVLEWTGGSLAADQEGAFPVTFTAPNAVGELLTFPAVQVCENGEVLSWIDGDPAGEYPAPRLLLLPSGSAPAATIDEVPPGAPGRDQLAAIVDIDNPNEEPPTTAGPPSSTTSEPGTPTSSTTGDTDGAPVPPDDEAAAAAAAAAAAPTTGATGSDGDSSQMPAILAAAAAAAIALGAGWYLGKRQTALG